MKRAKKKQQKENKRGLGEVKKRGKQMSRRTPYLT